MTRVVRRRVPSEASVRPVEAPAPPRAVPAPKTPFERARTIEDHGLWTGRKRVVLGIDTSLTAYGLVALCPDDLSYLTVLFRPKTKGVTRLLDIRRFLDWTLQEIDLRSDGVEHICMEGYSRASNNRREEMGECAGVTKCSLVDRFGTLRQVSYPTFVAPSTLKKYISGHGNEDKNLILKAVLRKWNVDVDSDNLADAYGLARMAAGIVTGETSHQYEADILAKIERHNEWQPPEQSPQQTEPLTSSGKVKTPSCA